MAGSMISKMREYFALQPVESDDNRIYSNYDDADYESRDYDRYDDRASRRHADDPNYDREYRRGYAEDYDDRDRYRDDYRDPREDRGVNDYDSTVAAPARARSPQLVRITLASFLQEKQIGEAFREGDIVVYDISAMEKSEAQRVVDFAAGIQVALGASTKPLAPRVFALIPEDVQLDESQLQQLKESATR